MKPGRLSSAAARLVAHLLLFAPLGPPIGAAAFLLLLGIHAALTQGVGADAPLAAWLGVMLWLFGLPAAFIAGTVPAVVAGVATSLLPRVPRPTFAAMAAAVGAASTAAVLAVDVPDFWDDGITPFVVGAGACAAAACGWLACGIGPLWRNTPYVVGSGE